MRDARFMLTCLRFSVTHVCLVLNYNSSACSPYVKIVAVYLTLCPLYVKIDAPCFELHLFNMFGSFQCIYISCNYIYLFARYCNAFGLYFEHLLCVF